MQVKREERDEACRLGFGRASNIIIVEHYGFHTNQEQHVMGMQ